MLLTYQKNIVGILLLVLVACNNPSSGSLSDASPSESPDTGNDSGTIIDFVFETREWEAINGAVTVNCVGGDFSTIQEAIDNTSDGDTVQVCAGTYNESLSIVDKSLSFEGYGEVIIEGNISDTEPLIEITDTPLDIGSEDVETHTVSFNYFWFTNNSNIFVYYAYGDVNLTVSHSIFSDFDSSADYLNGGIISVLANHDDEQPTLVISDTGFYNNLCRGMYGCLEFHDAAVSMENSTFGNNTAYPGVLFVYGSRLTVTNTVFEFNQTDGDSPYDDYDGTYGGLLYVTGDFYSNIRSEVEMVQTTFNNNSGDDAGVLFIDEASVLAHDCTFSGNTASTLGDSTNGLDLHGAVFLLTDYFGVAQNSDFSSVSSTWDSNDPYDVVIRGSIGGYTYTATSTNFECGSDTSTCE